MTEKQIKLPNKKGRNVKAKKELAKRVVSSDSEFSDSNEMKKTKKDIKKISADVSQLLANLKKEHGLGDDDDDGPQNKKKKFRENGNAKMDQAKQSKPKLAAKNAAQKNQKQQQKPGNQSKIAPNQQVTGNQQKGTFQNKWSELLIEENNNKKDPKNAQVKNDKKTKVKPVKKESNTESSTVGKKDKNKKAIQQRNLQKKSTGDVTVMKEAAKEDSPAKQLLKKKNLKKNHKPNPKQNQVAVEAPVNGEPEGKKSTANESPKKKNKNKNKKRKAATKDNNQTDASEPATKKKKDDAEEESTKPKNGQDNDADGAAEQKKDYYLKGANPICISNLPTNIKRKQILNKFKKFGKILAIRFRTNTGKSYLSRAQLKGVPFVIAFVYFDSSEAAKASLVMNGETFHDNVLSVDLDSRDITSKVQPKRTVMVGNLKYAVTQALLSETFACCGKIEYVRVIQTDRGCKGVAFICFENPDSVALALELNNTSLLDRPMHVERFKESKLKSSDKIKLKTKKIKIKNKNAGKPNETPQKKNNPIQAKSPNKKPKSPKEGKKKNKEFQGVKSNEKKKAHLTKNKKKKIKMHQDKRLALKVAPKENKPDNTD